MTTCTHNLGELTFAAQRGMVCSLVECTCFVPSVSHRCLS